MKSDGVLYLYRFYFLKYISSIQYDLRLHLFIKIPKQITDHCIVDAHSLGHDRAVIRWDVN